MLNISFHGTLLKEVTIKKLNNDGKYKPTKANFVELDHDDYTAIQEISEKWEGSKSGMKIVISESILEPHDIMKKKKNELLPLTKGMNKNDIQTFLSSKIPGIHIYIVTTQADNLKKIDSDKVLGFIELYSSQDICNICTVHVRPDCISEKYGNQLYNMLKKGFYNLFKIKDKTPKRPYANIGDTIITTIKNMFYDKKLTLIPLNDAKGFYRKHGFKKLGCNEIEYVCFPSYTRTDSKTNLNYDG